MNKAIDGTQAFTSWEHANYSHKEFPEEAVMSIMADAYCRGFNHAQNDHVRPDEDVAEPELRDLTADLKRLWEGEHR